MSPVGGTWWRMASRAPGAVSSLAADPKAMMAAWGNTSGSASPSLDSPSFGISSITDAGIGLLDVTWTRAFGGASTYAIVAMPQGNEEVRSVYLTTTQTATSIRLAIGIPLATLSDLTVGGIHFMAVGE